MKIRVNNAYLHKVNDKFIKSINGVTANTAVTSFPVSYDLDSSTTCTPSPTQLYEGDSVVQINIDNASSKPEVTFTNVVGTLRETVGNKQLFFLTNVTGDVTITASSAPEPGTCLLEDTLVLLADGTYKPIQDITYDDLVMTYHPYLNAFVGEYPSLITETTDGCTALIKRITLANGRTLDICWAHRVLIKEQNSYIFRAIEATEEDAALLGLEVVCWDVNTQTITTSPIVSCEFLFDKLFAKAYNVFVPVHGTIITNTMLTGGDLLMPQDAAVFSNILYHDGNRLAGNTENWALLASAMQDADEITGYAETQKIFGADISYRVYCTSLFQYTNAAERLCIPLPTDLTNLNETFKMWNACCKAFPLTDKVKIDDQVYEVADGGVFTFPAGECQYLDLSSNRIYNPGDQKRIWCSIVVKKV